jgi:predicted metal-dependent peptidase
MIGMDPEDANKAADYASWAILKNAGYPLPNDVYYSPDYNGLSMEAIYNLIHVEKPPQPASQPQPQEGAGAGSEGEGDEQDGEGEGDEDGDQESDKPANPGSDGEIRPLPANVNAEEHRHEWREAVLQAAQAAEAAGKMPAGMRQLVERIKNPQIPWREQLRKLVQPIIINQDFSYARPNRRWAPQGIFMPELRSERMPAGVILWDTSGSRDDEKARATAGAEVVSIIDEFRPEKLYVMYVDTEVHHVDVFEPDDIITFNPKGGGGTDFSSAFRHIEEQGWEPSFFVGITDMYATFPDKEPDYPVVWASTTDRPAPFGEVVRIKD